MSTDFKVKVNNTFSFDLEKESVSQLDAVSTEKDKFHILHQNQSYTVKINSNTYAVTISNKLDMLIKEMGFEQGVTKQVNSIKAPMPGLILEIFITAGQIVKENEALLILGAMKMENSFLSPREGMIKSVSVAVGDAVVKGQLLIEFE